MDSTYIVAGLGVLGLLAVGCAGWWLTRRVRSKGLRIGLRAGLLVVLLAVGAAGALNLQPEEMNADAWKDLDVASPDGGHVARLRFETAAAEKFGQDQVIVMVRGRWGYKWVTVYRDRDLKTSRTTLRWTDAAHLVVRMRGQYEAQAGGGAKKLINAPCLTADAGVAVTCEFY